MTPQTFPPIRELLSRLDIRLEKRKSQHFLKNQQVCAEIADFAGLTADHLAIEVGAGLGNLTVELAARAGQVIAVEMDDTFSEWHDYLVQSNPRLSLVRDDFLKRDLETLVSESGWKGPVSGVGNLPYQITSEVLFRFVDSPVTFDSLVFMIQKEVAERVCAGPGVRSSGALTYKIATRYSARLAMLVGPKQFIPPPQVESAVIVLTPLAKPVYADLAERDRLYHLVDRIFQYRRKTMPNALLMGSCARDKAHAQAALAACDIDEKRRPETLLLPEVLALCRVLEADRP